ncbi:MAG: 2-succinyl-6-hydroxy-2,4-cyclohexadiene-1-carboxylate synthase [Gemmatimonadaceae bacterium]
MTGASAVTHGEFDAGDDLRLHVAESGEGPPLILLHGFTGSTESWSPLRSAFDHAYRVIAVDHPGHGRSSIPSNPNRYRLDRFSDDLLRLIDSLSLDRVAVAGYSMGGRAALRFAIGHADRVAALVLESTSPGIKDAAQRVDRRAFDELLANDIERDGIESFVNRWERLPLWDTQRSLSDARRSGLRAQRLFNDPLGMANSLRGAGAGEESPVLDQAARICTPVLIIAGALDSRYVELGRLLERSIPDSRLELVANAGHAVHLEMPEAFAIAVNKFLSRIPSTEDHWT